jgi:hypothetical protein
MGVQAVATERFILDQNGSPVRRVMVYNPAETQSREGGSIHFVAQQDVTGLIEANKRAREKDQSKNVFRRVGSVPLVVYEKALREGWANDMKAWDRYLNENPAFKTWEGHL